MTPITPNVAATPTIVPVLGLAMTRSLSQAAEEVYHSLMYLNELGLGQDQVAQAQQQLMIEEQQRAIKQLEQGLEIQRQALASQQKAIKQQQIATWAIIGIMGLSLAVELLRRRPAATPGLSGRAVCVKRGPRGDRCIAWMVDGRTIYDV